MCSIPSCALYKMSNGEKMHNNNTTISNKEIANEPEELSNQTEITELSTDDIVFLEMDELLEEIGEFGKAQILLLIIFVLMIIPATYQVLIMVFIGANPPWICASNSTECIHKGVVTAGDDFYNARCTMKRDSWTYTESKKYSIITEVTACSVSHPCVYRLTCFFS